MRNGEVESFDELVFPPFSLSVSPFVGQEDGLTSRRDIRNDILDLTKPNNTFNQIAERERRETRWTGRKQRVEADLLSDKLWRNRMDSLHSDGVLRGKSSDDRESVS